ncbi:MAG TPA: sensor histidine kinase [Terracidiphilus sp.]|jgi:signal transduction histidine kinase
MQQLEHLPTLSHVEQKHVDTLVQTLTSFGSHREDIAALTHDARNMVTALDLYCDLLQQPGVLAEPFAHYASELRLVAAACRRLLGKLGASAAAPESVSSDEVITDLVHASKPGQTLPKRRWTDIPAEPIRNLAEELFINRNLLGAIAGPTIAVTVDAEGGAVPVRLTSEDLTRILVNLVKNAAEAMAGVGRIHISLWESSGEPASSPWVTLNVEDNGPGLPDYVIEKLFAPIADSNTDVGMPDTDRQDDNRGLGLSITRSLLEAAGGLIHAANRDPVGACFQIELPIQC